MHRALFVIGIILIIVSAILVIFQVEAIELITSTIFHAFILFLIAIAIITISLELPRIKNGIQKMTRTMPLILL